MVEHPVPVALHLRLRDLVELHAVHDQWALVGLAVAGLFRRRNQAREFGRGVVRRESTALVTKQKFAAGAWSLASCQELARRFHRPALAVSIFS